MDFIASFLEMIIDLFYFYIRIFINKIELICPTYIVVTIKCRFLLESIKIVLIDIFCVCFSDLIFRSEHDFSEMKTKLGYIK